MINTSMMVVLAASLLVLVVFTCAFLFVLSRLRRVIKSQVEAIEKMSAAVRAHQEQDEPGESSPR